jgi:hypothetical protein
MADMRATLEIKSWNDKIVKRHFESGLRAAFGDLGDAIVETARENVAIGRGPGPHPHISKHEDTGDLQASIEKQVGDGAKGPVLEVGFGEPYGLYLEMGWHSRAGNFFRYPWLIPAVDAQGRRMNFYLAKLKV